MRRLALLGLLLAGCTSQRDWALTASTIRLEAGTGTSNGNWDYHTKSADFSGDNSWVALSFAPLAYLEPPKQVLVRQALPGEDVGPAPYMKPAHAPIAGPDGRCITCGQKIP